ncbi:MAG TPA: SpoIIE family protein phosphatase [Candidatus Eisenbacteria bacterium]
MDRGASTHALSWMILPAAGTLLASALSLPSQPYTGVVLRESQVVQVVPGSPGQRAGLQPGDRLSRSDEDRDNNPFPSPLSDARPGIPLRLLRQGRGTPVSVTIVPEPLPGSERRMMAALLAVASGFMVLGGWVWSERRDGLTRPFYLLSLAFASLLSPPPLFSWAWATVAHDLYYLAATLALPALCVHFFALFPEPRAPRRPIGAGVAAGYGVAALLFAAVATISALRMLGGGWARPAAALLQAAAAVWFAAGLLWALVLFGRSYARAGSTDSRRRMRVALVGTVLGLGPLASLIVLRNLSPGTVVPGERWALQLTLLVPLSFAWATVVHRIFDFRVALRVATIALILGLMGAGVYFAGELATTWGGVDLTGVALALVALGAAVAGPARPWAGRLDLLLASQRMTPALAETLIREATAHEESAPAVLSRACEALMVNLMLDRCTAVELAPAELGARGPGPWLESRNGLPAPSRPGPELSPQFATALSGRSQPLSADDSTFTSADRDALESAGVQWVLPVGVDRPIAALLLGRRLAGPWLDRREVDELERFARHLGVTLENVALRLAARSHGAIDRELEQASAIQAHLLPRRAPVYPTLDCAAATLSCEPVGGDYYDFVERSQREFTLVVGDAAGKGVPAALLLAGVQARFRSEALRGRGPGQLLGALNLELAHLDRPEKFVGLLCARVDVRQGRMTFANAGLTPPLVRRRAGSFDELTEGGLLLGVRAEADYPDTSVELRGGDVALIYSDGLTEARRGEELFGLERVRRVLDASAGRRAADILAGLLGAVREFAEDPLDDLTVVVLKQLADPQAPWTTPAETLLKQRPEPVDTFR